MGFPRAGSNPARSVVFNFFDFIFMSEICDSGSDAINFSWQLKNNPEKIQVEFKPECFFVSSAVDITIMFAKNTLIATA